MFHGGQNSNAKNADPNSDPCSKIKRETMIYWCRLWFHWGCGFNQGTLTL